jgi:hypothetical protein
VNLQMLSEEDLSNSLRYACELEPSVNDVGSLDMTLPCFVDAPKGFVQLLTRCDSKKSAAYAFVNAGQVLAAWDIMVDNWNQDWEQVERPAVGERRASQSFMSQSEAVAAAGHLNLPQSRSTSLYSKAADGEDSDRDV